MTQPDVHSLYDQAAKRWPSVSWARDVYATHLGGENPAHAVDMYVAGAAGHRVGAAWEVIEEEFAPGVQRVLQRVPTADYAVGDLWGETRTKLMEDDPDQPALTDGRQPARIIRYRGQVRLLNYLVLIAKRRAITRQRRMRPTLSLTRDDEDEPQAEIPDTSTAAPDASLREQETAEKMTQAVRDAYAALTAEQQFLIMMVYRQGMKQKDTGAMLGWSPFKTTRQLGKAMDALLAALKDVLGADWTPTLAAAWSGCVAEAWADVQEPPTSASDTSAPPNGANG